MAKQPAAKSDPLEEEANERLTWARRWKEQWSVDFMEAKFFSMPNGQRQVSSQSPPPQTRMLDAPELNTDFAFELVGDFVTEVANTFMPEAQQWCERGRGQMIPQEVWDKIKDDVRKDDAQIFEAIKASNFYSEIPKAYNPYLAIGTVGLWIERPWPASAIVCSAIPLHELEINLGPYGEVDDRFAVRYTRNCYVAEILGPDVSMPQSVADKVKAKPQDRTEIVKGFWRKWDDHGDEVWQHVILVGKELVHSAEIRGEGSCPLIVARFGACAEWPWGIGPLLQYLPTLRQVDELEARKIEAVSRKINPPMGCPDDSFTNLEQGLEDGFLYPIRVGSQDAFKPLIADIRLEDGLVELQDKFHRLRKGFYVDYPEQTGDTPPTLGQWLDEMARAQRRIGTPGLPFWREGPAAYFTRYKYLLEAAGVIKPAKVDDKVISTRALNPAQRAAEQQEIAQAVQAIQIISQAFPEEFKAFIDGQSTMKALLDKMRVKLIVFRDPDTVNAAVQRIGQLLGSQHAPLQGTISPSTIPQQTSQAAGVP